jgi:hypothetical protein
MAQFCMLHENKQFKVPLTFSEKGLNQNDFANNIFHVDTQM